MQKKKEASISPSQIQSLKPNEAFIKLPGGFQTARVKLPIAKQ